MSGRPAEPDKFFPRTSWALLDAARGEQSTARYAQEEFARRYYQPIYEYLIAVVRDRNEAEELAQGFFADKIVSGRLLAQVDQKRGSFRPYLKQALRNYVASCFRSQNRRKRHPSDEVHPDQWEDGAWERLDAQVQTDADQSFHRAWVCQLLKEALERVRQICEERGQTQHWALFEGRHLSECEEPPAWKDLGEPFGLNEKEACTRAATVARHFRLVLRGIVREEVGADDLVDEEIESLVRFV